MGLTGISVVWFVVSKWRDMETGLARMIALGPVIGLLALGIVALGVVMRGVQAVVAYRIVGVRVGLPPMVRLSAASYAANKVTKSAGLAGLMPYYGDARRRGRTAGHVVGAYVCMQLAGTVALCVLIAVSTGALWVSGGLHGLAF